MKKIIFTLSIPFILSSCVGIRQLASQKITTKKACATLLMEKSIPMIGLEIDGKPAKFLFDTGATATVLTDSTAVPEFAAKEFGHLGSIKGADGKKLKNRILVCKVTSPVFESDNKLLIFVNRPNSYCQKNVNAYAGILGMDVFFKDGLSMQLDFTHNSICNLTTPEVDSIAATAGYFQVKSECESGKIFIFITIDGKELKFKLDTGFSGNLIIPYDKNTILSSSEKIELEGSLYRTALSETEGKEFFYENIPVTIGNETVASEVSVSSSITAQNVGINFIKGFDWIIDMENNRVFLRRNSQLIGRILPVGFAYLAKQQHGKLVIIVKEQSQAHSLGAEITSVDGVDVTADNVCSMESLLNKTKDWSKLDLKFRNTGN